MSTNTETKSSVTNINEATARYNATRDLRNTAEDLTRITAAIEMAGKRTHGGVVLGAVIARKSVQLQNRDGSTRDAEVAVVASGLNAVEGGHATTVRLIETGPSEARENGVPGEVAQFSFWQQGPETRGGVIDQGHANAISNPDEVLAQVLGVEVGAGTEPTVAELTAIAEGVQGAQMVAINEPGAEQVTMVSMGEMIPELHKIA